MVLLPPTLFNNRTVHIKHICIKTAVLNCHRYPKNTGVEKINNYQINIIISTTSGLCYKPITIINDDARVINKLEASLTDDARVVIYDRHMFIVQATDVTM